MIARLLNFNSHYRQPRGLIGCWIGGRMATQHEPENLWTLDLLNAQPTDHILEVGFGPGAAVEMLAPRVPRGRVSGADFSAAMVRAARRRNRAAAAEERVDLREADVASLPFGDAEFDKAYSIHSIYFWPAPAAALRELHRVLKPGGRLVLTLMPEERMLEDFPVSDEEESGFTNYTGARLVAMLRAAGFQETRIEDEDHPQRRSNYSVIGVK